MGLPGNGMSWRLICIFYLKAQYPPDLAQLIVAPIKDRLNWYEYCGGDPVNWVDPMGLMYLPEDVDYGQKIVDPLLEKAELLLSMNHKYPIHGGMSCKRRQIRN